MADSQSANMNWKGLCASLARTLVWPAAVLLIAVFFKSAINDICSRITKISYAGVTVALTAAIEDYATLAEIDSQGIQTPEQLQEVKRIARTSPLYESLLKQGTSDKAAARLAKSP